MSTVTPPATLPGWMALLLVALLVGLSGCSAVRLSYNQGPALAYWWLDRYADFGHAQQAPVKSALEGFFAWHRASELPEYAQALARLQRLAPGEIGAEQMCQEFAQWQQRGLRAWEHALPAIAGLVPTLTADNLAQIQKRYAANLKDAEKEYLQPDPDERRKANVKRTLERAEDMYGRLDEAQRHWLAEALAGSPFDAPTWLAERRARQNDVLRLLREWQATRPDAATIQAGLRRLPQEMLASPREPYRVYAQKVQQANCVLAAQLHARTSPKQRQHLVGVLKGWEEDARALHAAPAF